jgi:L-2-hydroxyglutarate oxidase LhgO
LRISSFIEIADTIVIGAGVVGLAVARQLAQTGHEVLVLEANGSFGMETSSRNSGVIHAGIYYPPGSLKAFCCVRGKQLLYDYCKLKHVPHKRCGKLVIAASAGQQDRLKALHHNAINSGVDDLVWLEQDRVHDLEPNIRASAALHSPSTGIIDIHELMLALLADLEAAGGTLITHSKVLGGKVTAGGLELNVDSGGECTFSAARVINAAGHGAVGIASRISGFPASEIPTVYPVSGHYFEHRGKLPFSSLIYPLPDDTGLGIHATIDLAGQGRFGPDAEYCDALDYRFDESRKPLFTEAIRTWYPGLDESRLQPGFVGVRPKLQGPGEKFRDFEISGPAKHGIKGLTNLFGIDSPGLTSCLALAEKFIL